jgi:tetratricopeptide (TPR) repeat protein
MAKVHGTIFAKLQRKEGSMNLNRAIRPLIPVKLAIGQKVMSRRRISVALALLGILAFCTNAVPKSLDLISNEPLKSYAINELELGAPSLPVTSKLLYREALGLLKEGNKERAKQKLELAASLTGDYAAPLFTLGRIELLEANPDFLPLTMEGIRRLVTSYPSQAVLAANAAVLLLASLAGALLATLIALLVKYWPLIDHRIVEIYSRRFSAPPARWIIAFIFGALLFMRLGAALYITVLVVVLWSYLSRKEKGIIVAGMLLLAAASFGAPYSNCFAPAIDPGSVTNRLALVNRRGVSEECIRRIRGITGERFQAHKDFALGTMMYRLGLYDAAQKHFLEAVSARPDFAPAFVNLGNVYFMQGDYDKALAGYQSAVELDSTSAVAHYNIGQTFIKKMLFAPSGLWLEKANMLGIEAYRSAHPAIGFGSASIYEEDFKPKDLWTIAEVEGANRKNVLIGEILQPFLLFPFRWLWVLFSASLTVAILVAWRLPEAWRIAPCDNCGKGTCSECEDTETGIRLCRDCAEVIRDLSSIKVMEALLRNKRQKMTIPKHDAYRWRTMFFPGVSRTQYGNILSGFGLSFVSVGALAFLAWNGLYFKDPLSMNTPAPVWQALLPCAVLAVAWLLSYRSKPQQEPRNYHIFPAEIRMQELKKEKEKREEAPDPWKDYDAGKSPEKTRAPEPRKAPDPDGIFIGEIEKGSKWH